jgi:hypothetical protein
VAFEKVRDCVKEIPVRREQDGGKILCFLKHLGIIDPLIAGPAKIKNFVACALKECDSGFREILVEQELHATAP